MNFLLRQHYLVHLVIKVLDAVDGVSVDIEHIFVRCVFKISIVTVVLVAIEPFVLLLGHFDQIFTVFFIWYFMLIVKLNVALAIFTGFDFAGKNSENMIFEDVLGVLGHSCKGKVTSDIIYVSFVDVVGCDLLLGHASGL